VEKNSKIGSVYDVMKQEEMKHADDGSHLQGLNRGDQEVHAVLAYAAAFAVSVNKEAEKLTG